jgi:hypothetical protein
MGAELAVQAALYVALAELGLAVSDAAGQRAGDGGFPNVEVGAVVMADWDDKGQNGFDWIARIHTRSRSAGMAETKTIQGTIYARLHNGALTIEGQRLVMLRRTMSDVTRVSDGSFHGVCEYRGLIETI